MSWPRARASCMPANQQYSTAARFMSSNAPVWPALYFAVVLFTYRTSFCISSWYAAMASCCITFSAVLPAPGGVHVHGMRALLSSRGGGEGDDRYSVHGFCKDEMFKAVLLLCDLSLLHRSSSRRFAFLFCCRSLCRWRCSSHVVQPFCWLLALAPVNLFLYIVVRSVGRSVLFNSMLHISFILSAALLGGHEETCARACGVWEGGGRDRLKANDKRYVISSMRARCVRCNCSVVIFRCHLCMPCRQKSGMAAPCG